MLVTFHRSIDFQMLCGKFVFLFSFFVSHCLYYLSCLKYWRLLSFVVIVSTTLKFVFIRIALGMHCSLFVIRGS